MELAQGLAYFQNGQYAEAIAAFRQFLQANPHSAEAWFHLGNTLWKSGDAKSAVVAQRNSLRFAQTSSAFNSLGLAFLSSGSIDEAIGAFQKAMNIDPNLAEAMINLGNVERSIGHIGSALALFERAVEITRDDVGIASENILFTEHYVVENDLKALANDHREWGNRLNLVVPRLTPHADRTDRQLRVGFVSADFNAHAAARFLLPLFQNLDRSKFQLHLYSNNTVNDDRTAQFQKLADVWRDIRPLNDDAAAQLILRDRIDVLFDLSLHTEGNRLRVFARRVAPVQATWLGYASTTGVRTMDYRLSDRHLDPDFTEDKLYVEKTIRLPDSFWCFQPFEVTPDVGPTPVASNGYVTFGSLNNFAKVNRTVQLLWSIIISSVPNSRIIIHCPRGSYRGEIRKLFALRNVPENRIEFVEFLPTPEYLSLHNRIDIALDPFPFNGGTTTCDALWMGVPIVTLLGKFPVGRAGTGFLNSIDAPELVAQSHEDYVKIAVELARDPSRIAQYRSTLRNRMRNSPLMDAPRFARNFEGAIRQMWFST